MRGNEHQDLTARHHVSGHHERNYGGRRWDIDIVAVNSREVPYGAVAYMQADESADAYAERQGLFVIRATGRSRGVQGCSRPGPTSPRGSRGPGSRQSLRSPRSTPPLRRGDPRRSRRRAPPTAAPPPPDRTGAPPNGAATPSAVRCPVRSLAQSPFDTRFQDFRFPAIDLLHQHGAYLLVLADRRQLDTTPVSTCAVERRCISAGENPARQLSLQPEAVGAVQGGNELG